MQKNIEIVSPAGNLEKMIFAVKYGADNVYFGSDQFNLRVKAGNFSYDDIKDGIDYCKKNNVKTTFLMNSFLHESDVDSVIEYAQKIKELQFDSVMISDPGMLMILKQVGIDADFHLSTQMSTLNSYAAKFWIEAGFKRIVLAREATIDEIKNIKKNTGAEIEVFVHGALCIAYSGRCLLSRYMQSGDANSGDCTQPCRWKYSLMEEKREGDYFPIVEHDKGTEILSSKDLMLIERLEEYIDAGVDAFKIEGRMKSLYYTANTTRIYKHALRKSGTEEFKKFLPFWLEELDLINHRPYTTDLFNEFREKGYDGIPYIKNALFIGYREDDARRGGILPPAPAHTDPTHTKDKNDASNEIILKTLNPIYQNEILEAIYPIKDEIIDSKYRVLKIFFEDKEIEMGRPNMTYRILFDKPVFKDAIFRRRLNGIKP
ncbi:MAG: U32 family peptidase [Leptospirales bacterium]|nr:U32 family peptidase [Leptospirales bacterium]